MNINLPDSFPIHLLILFTSIPAFILLVITLKNLRYAGIMVNIMVSFILLLANIIIYSFIYLIDVLDRSPINVYFYNFWSLFLRTHASATMLWSAIELKKRFKNKSV